MQLIQSCRRDMGFTFPCVCFHVRIGCSYRMKLHRFEFDPLLLNPTHSHRKHVWSCVVYLCMKKVKILKCLIAYVSSLSILCDCFYKLLPRSIYEILIELFAQIEFAETRKLHETIQFFITKDRLRFKTRNLFMWSTDRTFRINTKMFEQSVKQTPSHYGPSQHTVRARRTNDHTPPI